MVKHPYKGNIKIESIYKSKNGGLWTIKGSIHDRTSLARHGIPIFLKWSSEKSPFPTYLTTQIVKGNPKDPKSKKGDEIKDIGVKFEKDIKDDYAGYIFDISAKEAEYALSHYLEDGEVKDKVKYLSAWVFSKTCEHEDKCSCIIDQQIVRFFYKNTEEFVFA